MSNKIIATTANGTKISAPRLGLCIINLENAIINGNKAGWDVAEALNTAFKDSEEVMKEGGYFKTRKEFYEAVGIGQADGTQKLVALDFANRKGIDTAKTSVGKVYFVAAWAKKNELEVSETAHEHGYKNIKEMLEDAKVSVSTLKEWRKEAGAIDVESTEVSSEKVEEGKAEEGKAEEETKAETKKPEEKVEVAHIKYNNKKYEIPVEVLKKYEVK